MTVDSKFCGIFDRRRRIFMRDPGRWMNSLCRLLSRLLKYHPAADQTGTAAGWYFSSLLNRISDWRRIGVFVALMSTILMLEPSGVASAGVYCIPLKQGEVEPGLIRYGPEKRTAGRTVINKPGNYCAAQDFRVEGHYWPITPEGDKLFSDDELVFMLTASDIHLDLRGHRVSSDAALRYGIQIPLGEEIDGGPYRGPPILFPKNISISNGSIDVECHGVAIGIFGVGPEGFLENIVIDEPVNKLSGDETDRSLAKYRNARNDILRRTFRKQPSE